MPRRPWDAPAADPGAEYVCPTCARLIEPGRCSACSPRIAGDGRLVGPLVAILVLLLLAMADRVDWSSVPAPVSAGAGLLFVLVVAGCAAVAVVERAASGKRGAWPMLYGRPS